MTSLPSTPPRPTRPPQSSARTLSRLGLCLAFVPVQAWADTPAPASGQNAGQALASGDQAASADIVVTGRASGTTTTIDRKSYSLANDLQAKTGSVADVLRNLPSVTVDVDGNPSLRGDANVQILIDGRPAPQFNKANRGAALEQLGADTIDRVEVLTNPPANFKPDGSAGIINIVTKHRRGRGAAVQANIGSGGRFNLGGTGNTSLGALAVHGALSVRRDVRDRSVTDRKQTSDATTGAFRSATLLGSDSRSDRLSESATLGGDLDLGKIDHLSAEGSYTNRFDHASYAENDTSFDPAGATTGRASRDRPGTEKQTSSSAMLRYRHDISHDGSNLTVLAQRSETTENQQLHYADSVLLPAADPTEQRQSLRFGEVTRELSIDFTRMMPAQAKLILGYNLQRDDNHFDNFQSVAVAAGGAEIADPNFTNVFRFGQTVQAWYGSYERSIGKLTVLAGLRVEQTNVQTDQVTSDERGSRSYFRAYPNLHLMQKLTDHQTIGLSYGNRVIRPDADDLNPYLIQRDAFTLRRGNPNLMPQEIQSFEASWSYEQGATSRSATLFYRRIHNSFTVVTTPIDASTVLVTEENLGRSQSGGIELAAAGRILRGITYTISGNLLYNQIDASNLGYAGTRSTVSFDAKAGLDWSLDAKNVVQANVGAVGRRLTPQGYRKGYVTLDLGYQRKLRPNLTLTATVSDVFASRREASVIDTPGLSERIDRRLAGQIALVGLSWNLSGTKKKGGNAFQ
ncbi:TonB-dependent receptor domain-containing protein [Sphingomonas nostoxanthinifaciens]|uniref:TonB-dependent receptor domain-containing protein n=1 Tax=Sphingomonas nostoxanthinifaciens TaxID=2872652 RepID=UPI001CC1DE17|nr:TonB-dependent receptor [Sphingomonas nostoxanthinifaciens]UAK23929.1 TonB-dependent receptor [Sphingomonas nostoxanthinifaciens]